MATWFSIGTKIRKGLDRAFLIPKALARDLANSIVALNRRLARSDKIWIAFLASFTIVIVLVLASSIEGDIRSSRISPADDSVQANMTPAEHLAKAKSACGNGNDCIDIFEARHQLSQIATSAPEHSEAVKLKTAMDQQEIRQNEEEAQRRREQMERNFAGEAHDSFSCDTSTENQPRVSFDDGITWWKDDGRCEARRQAQRDADAQIRSYWSTTVRVNTDMDSFWLPDEERTCQTYPDEKGRVATVTCDATAHAIHNIPVQFWGGVDRNIVSNWKCRREKDIFSDQFVCRAID
jgi:hypothetical protein